MVKSQYMCDKAPALLGDPDNNDPVTELLAVCFKHYTLIFEQFLQVSTSWANGNLHSGPVPTS